MVDVIIYIYVRTKVENQPFCRTVDHSAEWLIWSTILQNGRPFCRMVDQINHSAEWSTVLQNGWFSTLVLTYIYIITSTMVLRTIIQYPYYQVLYLGIPIGGATSRLWCVISACVNIRVKCRLCVGFICCEWRRRSVGRVQYNNTVTSSIWWHRVMLRIGVVPDGIGRLLMGN